MRQRRSLIVGSVLVGGFVVLGTFLFVRGRPAQGDGSSAEDDPANPRAVRVRVVAPRQGGLERTVTRPGTVHSFQYAQLFAKVAGYLHDQVVDIGYRVKKGDVLTQIDAPEIETNVKQAEADLKKARAQVQVMEARQKSAKAELCEANVKVEQAQADVQNAAAMLRLRGEQYERIKKLVELKSVEQELADEKMEAKKAAESNELAKRKGVETAKVAVETAEAHVAAAAADLADAQAQVGVARAALARARVFAGYLKVRAPFDGVVTRRNYHEGDFIRAGSDNGNKPVLTIARTDLMRVIVDVPDPDVPFTHAGARAVVQVNSLPGQTFSGQVARTARAEDYNTRTMRTEIDLPNPNDTLADGMFGNVTIFLGADPHALTIPTACLVGPEREGQRRLYVVRDDGVHAEVQTGLQAGEQVIAGHGPGLADGVPVAVE